MANCLIIIIIKDGERKCIVAMSCQHSTQYSVVSRYIIYNAMRRKIWCLDLNSQRWKIRKAESWSNPLIVIMLWCWSIYDHLLRRTWWAIPFPTTVFMFIAFTVPPSHLYAFLISSCCTIRQVIKRTLFLFLGRYTM